jgi:hypothetical protein
MCEYSLVKVFKQLADIPASSDRMNREWMSHGGFNDTQRAGDEKSGRIADRTH